MIDHLLVTPVTIYQPLKDEYGASRITDGTETMCWFRQIDELDHTLNREERLAAAMARFAPTAVVAEGAILLVHGNYYRVTTVIYARRMESDSVVYIKCLLERHEGTVS